MGDRKKYWNQSYVNYWKARVDESTAEGEESKVVANDAKTEEDQFYIDFFKKYPFNTGNVLDVGCAWGRMFYMYKQHNLKIYGVDISENMIVEALKQNEGDQDVVILEESEAETLRFNNEFFDNVCCIASFDATYQDKALSEFMRVLKTGGKLYITGKNINYRADDGLAYNAEFGARSKGHPNYFTDVKNMVDQLSDKGHKIVVEQYFPKRGDFAENNFKSKMPEYFYEWFLVVEKGSDDCHFDKLSDLFSNTFKKISK